MAIGEVRGKRQEKRKDFSKEKRTCCNPSVSLPHPNLAAAMAFGLGVGVSLSVSPELLHTSKVWS